MTSEHLNQMIEFQPRNLVNIFLELMHVKEESVAIEEMDCLLLDNEDALRFRDTERTRK